MSKDDELFQPEQVDKQIERLASTQPQQTPLSSDARLIHDLRQFYAEEQDIVEHVWTNLTAQAAMRKRQEQTRQNQPNMNIHKEQLKGVQPNMNISNAKQPQNKFIRFLEISIAILVVAVLAAGGTVLLMKNARQQPSQVGSGGTATPIVNPTATATSIPATATSTPATATTLPCNTARQAIMTPLPNTTGPAVFYVTGAGGYQALPSATSLIRYDLATGKQTTLVAPANNLGISDVKLSPDKQWLLFSTYMQNQNQSITKLQLIRTDGSMLQTLYESCSGFSALGLAWSPDEQLVAFANPTAGINVLNLTNGQMQTFLSRTTSFPFLPSFWINNQQLLIEQNNNTNYDIYLLDIRKGVNQQVTNLTRIATIPMFCGNIALSDDGSQLFSSSCTPFNGNCQGGQVQGPSTVSMQSSVDNRSNSIYNSQNRAVTAIHPISTSSLLIYIENTTGDLSQDGLWKINTNGSGLTRLTTTNALPCQYGEAAYPFTQIASDSQSYALLHFDGGVQKLVTGSLTGGSPTTIATRNANGNISILLLAGIGTF